MNTKRPSSHDFQSVLTHLVDEDAPRIVKGFAMLRAHYYAEGMAMSAEDLAISAEMKSYHASNTHYGKFARHLSEMLGYEPPEAGKDDKTRWTYLLATYPGDRNAKGDHLWYLRPEVAQALEDMKLVRKRVPDSPMDDIEVRRPYLDTLSEKDRAAMIRARFGQGEFRSQLIKFWGGCSVTGCTTHRMLVASHVKPWRDCDVADAKNLCNGLLLTPNLDKAFDIGYISFGDTGDIKISDALTVQSAYDLGISPQMKLQRMLNSTQQHFMQYHRANILVA